MSKSNYTLGPIGRVLNPGPNHAALQAQHAARKIGITVRSFEEYSKEGLLESDGYWTEGELVYTQSYVDRLVAVMTVGEAQRKKLQEADGPDYSKAETTAVAPLEWRWVDENGRGMTPWKQGELPPVLNLADSKGVMRVEARVTTLISTVAPAAVEAGIKPMPYTPHKWESDRLGGGHNGEYGYTCMACGKTDWLPPYGKEYQLDKSHCPGATPDGKPVRRHL